MNVLITGANGFVGKNLTQRLSTIKDHRDRTRPALQIEEILLCTRDTSAETLAGYCQKADFVVHLAGVNRPQDPGEFAAGNTDFTRTLLEMLRKSGNRCPVLLSSSIQASLTGRYAGNPYGQSKKAAEELLLAYGEETGAAGMIYRLPNLFGKWCRPNYNSAVATFCHHIAREELITVSDPAVELELVYIDDLIDEILDAMEGQPHRTDGAYCSVPVSHRVTLGEIVRLLQTFHDQPQTLLLPEIPEGSFEKKLYSTYLAYLPPEKIAFPLKMNKRISDLTSQNQTLAFLKQQGLVDPDIFIAKTNELTKQLRQAKQEKEKLMDAESDMTALQTRDLIDLLKGGPEFLDSFDAELFGELVEKIIIESNDSVRFCLKNGLELRESIERTMR